jgi:ABC-type lipoprotein export system ATPase subunit
MLVSPLFPTLVAQLTTREFPIVLADEPTGSLDVRTGEEVCALLLEVCREQGNLTVVVTHSAELARSVDQVFEMLPGGQLVGRGRGI